EMVSFRRWVTALALLVALAGMAGAQSQNLQCGTNTSVTPTLRSEGYTEQTGDIILSCTGGVNQVVGSVIPQVNITLFYNTAVTSRLLPITNVSNNTSEALLLIDDPGSGVLTYGAGLPQILCSTPTTGCIQYVSTGGAVPVGQPANSCTTFSASGSCTSTTSATIGQNVFQ